jgi:hypothetical protein
VTGTTADNAAGGVYNSVGTVTLSNGDSVTGNSPDICAGTAIAGGSR